MGLDWRRVIDPFEGSTVTELPHGRTLPYGLTSNGYILRLHGESAAMTSYTPEVALDPKKPPAAMRMNRLDFIPGWSSLVVLSLECVQLPAGKVGRLELLPEYALYGLRLASSEVLTGAEHDGTELVLTLVNPLPSAVLLYPGEGLVRLVLTDAPVVPVAEREWAGVNA